MAAKRTRGGGTVAVDENKHEHLKRIGTQKGQPSRNPKGRPCEDEALKGQIRRKLPDLIDRLEEIAIDGKNEASAVKAIEIMMGYIMPKAATKVEHEVTHNFGDFLSRVNKRRHVDVIEATAEDIMPVALSDARPSDQKIQ